jgi:hypothetical protein
LVQYLASVRRFGKKNVAQMAHFSGGRSARIRARRTRCQQAEEHVALRAG